MNQNIVNIADRMGVSLSEDQARILCPELPVNQQIISTLKRVMDLPNTDDNMVEKAKTILSIIDNYSMTDEIKQILLTDKNLLSLIKELNSKK